MTLMEKIENLTPAQREQFDALADEAELDAFIKEQALEFSEEDREQTIEYFKTGVLPLDDDELDEAAGGMSKDDARALAAADGRTHMLPPATNICLCHNRNKWARHYYKHERPGYIREKVWLDVKCYKCGKTKDEHIRSWQTSEIRW